MTPETKTTVPTIDSVFYSKPFQYRPVHAVVLQMHTMHEGYFNLSGIRADLFLGRQKQESNRCRRARSTKNILSMIPCCRVLRTFSVFQLKVMKSLGALTACLA